MKNVQLQQLRRRYELESAILRLERRSKELAEKLTESKFSRTACKEAVMNYEGGLRGFFDGLTGKKQEKLEQLNRELRTAQARLDALSREQEAILGEQNLLRRELETLPVRDALREQAAQDPAMAAEAASMEARFCAEALIPLLDGNYKALFELRRFMRGEYAGQIMSYEEQQSFYTDPNAWGEQCRILLERIQTPLAELGILFEIPAYYRAPTAFIPSAAAEHTRRDRVNQALDQTVDTKKQAASLLAQLDN